MHRCTNFGSRSPWRQLCKVATNICGFLVCSLLHNTILAPKILRWLLDFFENLYIPLVIIDINGLKPDIYTIFKHSIPIAQKIRCLRYTERQVKSVLKHNNLYFFFLWLDRISGRWPPHCRGCEVTDTPHQLLILWMSDRPLPDVTHTTLTRERHPCPRWDSNTQSQQASQRRRAPSTTRLPG